MASSTCTPLSLSSTLIDGKAHLRQSASASSQCLSLPKLPLQSQIRAWKTSMYCRKIVRDVAAMATGEIATKEVATEETPTVEAETELPEVFETIQEAWNKVDDKYAVTSLGVAAAIALIGSSGLISAIDRLPLVPGVLELVGIGYTGWFAYKNLIFKPEREALLQKIKSLYSDVV
ncbi:protein CURVATURE THYLAKOID 1B, chloroplastic [Heracleum sosnowskyi]|uniref:Protein CURVATURE THYLAKOID 1B, chloroplastic n=1 Tax=Heracleum sosnowskyi TaxID=360622 RepID=A0AAD8HP69_9APIA|nr:protein CURVATURE THYLAKOID 1B, chloroplastic [Heracleum sosnowskyi]